MPIREPRKMTGEEIREQLSLAEQIGCRVQSARRVKIHSSATRFDMRLRIKTRLAPDIALEGGRVLTEVMPQTGQSSPLRDSKLHDKTSSKNTHRPQKHHQSEELPASLLVLINMGQGSL